MIHCKYCGITYRDSATICLRCRNPLPRPTYIRTPEQKQKPIETVLTSNVGNKPIKIATATPPPSRLLGTRIA